LIESPFGLGFRRCDSFFCMESVDYNPMALQREMSKTSSKPVTIDRDFQGALSALQAGKLGDAARLFDAVLHIEPKHAGALNLMAVALMQLGRFTEAESYFRRALQHAPPSDVTLYNYGIVLKS
jgi:Tfp pilus assembly protein PilF